MLKIQKVVGIVDIMLDVIITDLKDHINLGNLDSKKENNGCINIKNIGIYKIKVVHACQVYF